MIGEEQTVRIGVVVAVHPFAVSLRGHPSPCIDVRTEPSKDAPAGILLRTHPRFVSPISDKYEPEVWCWEWLHSVGLRVRVVGGVEIDEGIRVSKSSSRGDSDGS